LIGSLALDALYTLYTFLLVLVATSTIVEITDVLTVKQRLVYSLVDNVVGKAQPSSGCVATARLGRILGEQLSEMRRTLAARI